MARRGGHGHTHIQSNFDGSPLNSQQMRARAMMEPGFAGAMANPSAPPDMSPAVAGPMAQSPAMPMKRGGRAMSSHYPEVGDEGHSRQSGPRSKAPRMAKGGSALRCMHCGGMRHGGSCAVHAMAKGGHADEAQDRKLFHEMEREEGGSKEGKMRKMAKGGKVEKHAHLHIHQAEHTHGHQHEHGHGHQHQHSERHSHMHNEGVRRMAAGGVAKIRREQSDSKGNPKNPPTRKSPAYE